MPSFVMIGSSHSSFSSSPLIYLLLKLRQPPLLSLSMNVSATINFLRLIERPSLCLPHATIPTFNDLPVSLPCAFGPMKPDIRAVVLDKDNCFALPKENSVYKPYAVGSNSSCDRHITEELAFEPFQLGRILKRLLVRPLISARTLSFPLLVPLHAHGCFRHWSPNLLESFP